MATKSINSEEFKKPSISNDETLFYVRNQLNAVAASAMVDAAEGVSYDYSRNFIRKHAELSNNNINEIKSVDFKNMLQKVSHILEDILNSEEPNGPEEPKNPKTHRNPNLNKSFELDEIEINLAIEAGAQFFVTTKGNAGISLKYKRKKND